MDDYFHLFSFFFQGKNSGATFIEMKNDIDRKCANVREESEGV